MRSEQQIVEDIALESERLGAAQQALAGLEDRRSGMLTTRTLDEIHALANSVTRAKLGAEIAQSRLDALNGELRRFYATQARAAIDAEMAPLTAIDAEERQVLSDYEQHARLVAVDLARLRELQDRRHQVSVRVHQLNGQWIPADSPIYRGALAQQMKLPSIAGPDIWPASPHAALLDAQARAARDAAALEEYHREGR